MTRSRSLGSALLALLVAAAPAAAATLCPRCVDRGGTPRSACFARLSGVEGSRGRRCAICCTDGDPSCDRDGTANGECRFLPSVCLNVDDVALRPCVPGDVVRFAVQGERRDPERRALADGVRALLPAPSAACGPPGLLTLRLGRAGRARTVLRTRAWSSRGGARDDDRVVLECRRGPCGGVLARCSEAAPAAGRSWSAADRALLAAADARALTLRRHPLTVRVVGRDGRPRAHRRIAAAQISHAFPLGTAVVRHATVRGDPRYLGLLGRLFNVIVTENSLKWAEVEPVEGVTDDADAADWLAWAGPRGLALKGTALVWGAPQGVPAWLAGRSPPEVGAAIERHVTETVGRFRGRVALWDVVNEPVNAGLYVELLGPGHVAGALRRARSADPDATLVVNEHFPYGSRAALLERVDAFTTLLRDHVLAAGVAPDAIGFQGHARERPLEWTQTALDGLAALGLPIHVTELDVVPLDDEATQADAYEGILRLAFGHPAVTSIMLWGFDDAHHWLGAAGAGMYTAGYRPKAAARAVLALLEDRWRTRVSGRTDADGTFRFVGFPGRYRIAIRRAAHDVDLGDAADGVVRLP